jgi:hypothetical protein
MGSNDPSDERERDENGVSVTEAHRSRFRFLTKRNVLQILASLLLLGLLSSYVAGLC